MKTHSRAQFRNFSQILLFSAAIGTGFTGCNSQYGSTVTPFPGQGSKGPSCNKAQLVMGKSATSNLNAYLEAAVMRLSHLSRKQKFDLFVDKDVKGKRIHTATATSDFEAPWSQKDFGLDKVPGTSTSRAYRDLKLKDKGAPVIVAVIDTGMDLNHEAIKAHAWVNANTQGADGYPGDVQGWNFLGTKDGGSIDWTNLEVTREVRRMRKLKQTAPLTSDQQSYLDRLEKEYAAGSDDSKNKLSARTTSLTELQTAIDTLKGACQITDATLDQVNAVQSTDPTLLNAKTLALKYLSVGHDVTWFNTSIVYWKQTLQYYYNLDFNPSALVGDNPEVMDEKGYGTPNILPIASDEDHATHVAGIIGAIRDGSVPIEGQVSNVRLMSLKAVPNGDERDKDIGNAIRFAVDHGARVINMSFGKNESPNRDYVWTQLSYARDHDVLIVHAAGNDSLDNDKNTFYPNRLVTDDAGHTVEQIDNMIEVGASTNTADKSLPASFSDYGQTSVDLFAPGQQILSSIPGNQYAEFDGTSMATPEVTGIAALVLSQYPNLNVVQLKKLLLDTVQQFKFPVLLPNADPNTPDKMVPFTELSITGGVINAYDALEAASKL